MKNSKNFMIKAFAMTITFSFIAIVSPVYSEPVPGGPGYFIQPASAFRPRVSTASFTITGSTLASSVGPVVYYAPVSLPQGATINKFILYYLDNDAALNIEAILFRVPLPGDHISELSNLNSSGSSPARTFSEDTTIVNPVVDNRGFGYYVRLYLPASPNLSVDGFRIDYNYPTNLPLIMK